ncbi:MAG: hypothetical protein EXS14_00380 [Planctomycetes bacterium]|nr:hypothetical protein [Planctomycetota bacterium]
MALMVRNAKQNYGSICPSAGSEWAHNPVDHFVAAAHEQRARFAADTAAAEQVLSHDEHPRPMVDKAECAAWTLLCSVLLNLDETLTRN